MDTYQRLKKKFDEREKILLGSSMFLDSTVAVEAMARHESVDALLFDCEHGLFNAENLVPYLQIMRLLGKTSIVRIADSEYHLVARLMDLGADGVMVPRVESVEQLKRVMDGLHFPPVGKTGFGGHAQLRFGEALADYAKTRFLLPQIESPAGVENLPAMLDIYGEYISAIIIGPYDMSINNGTPGEITSSVNLASIQRTFDICKNYGKSCGIFCSSGEYAKLFRRMGANVIWLATDLAVLMRGYNETIDEAKDL